jgi:hypothetical protein
VNFNVTDQLLITYSAFTRYYRKYGSIVGQYISHFVIPMKIARLIKMCLNDTYSKIPMLGGSPFTMAWHALRLGMEGRPPDTEGGCKYIE